MGIVSTIILVFFVIVCILLVLLVLVQTEEGDGLGGIFGGGSASAFGSRSGNILTKITTVLGASFLIVSLGLALINRTQGGAGVLDAGLDMIRDEEATDWLDAELHPPPPPVIEIVEPEYLEDDHNGDAE